MERIKGKFGRSIRFKLRHDYNCLSLNELLNGE
jgi:hypothetical protein